MFRQQGLCPVYAHKTKLGFLLVGLLAVLAGTSVFVFRQPSSFDTRAHSVDEPASLWAVVNKARALPRSYTPADLVIPSVPLRADAPDQMMLRAEAARALEQLMIAGRGAGVELMLLSGYRSYSEQATIHARSIAAYGRVNAERFSARAGHSEHQTGLAADVAPRDRRCELDRCFGATVEGKWLAKNAYRYGFTVRYPKGRERITGYEYEPWHVRYVGTELAAELHRTREPVERLFGLPSHALYPAVIHELKPGGGSR